MPSVEGHIVCSHTDFVTSFLYFDTKSWTLTGSCALISLIIARVEFEMKGDSDAELNALTNFAHVHSDGEVQKI